jgi:serine O-acetyltransferase
VSVHSTVDRVRAALITFRHALQEDFAFMRRARAKYLNDDMSESAFPVEVAKKIGLQMMVAVRTMHLVRDAGAPMGAQVVSRMIRYVYGAEIHYQSQWAAGVNIVHGNGLVVGSGAIIGPGSVLFHNVTLGDAFDKTTGRIGGPILVSNVHVGPGCALLGPITIGEHSKLMAGSTLDCSVPARSLVRPAQVQVVSRSDG